jgi:predicted Zn-ribbon and HTH transcriptional regulator
VKTASRGWAPKDGLFTDKPTVLSQPASACPGCGWWFESRPCCGDPRHDFATQCPRCKSVFISAVTP